MIPAARSNATAIRDIPARDVNECFIAPRARLNPPQPQLMAQNRTLCEGTEARQGLKVTASRASRTPHPIRRSGCAAPSAVERMARRTRSTGQSGWA